MRLSFYLLPLLCIIALHARTQDTPPPSINIGAAAPPLHIRAWLKGAPVQKFEKGNVYVVEFWATWCKPCIAGMPHLSTLAAEYKDRVSVLGIDIYEKKTTPIEKIKTFVDSMGPRMDYHVAAEEGDRMETDWLDATGDKNKGIPISYVVNAEGQIAWIGRPGALDEVLPKIVNKTWDIKEALTKRNWARHLQELDDSLAFELDARRGDAQKPDKNGKQDSALLMIDQMVRNEPDLKYAPRIASYTFSTLLQINPQEAYEYGKVLLVTPTYEDPPYYSVIGAIELYSYKYNLTSKIYGLCAEAYQDEIDHYPGAEDIPNDYHKMAEWYWRACERSKAIDAEEKAIAAAKRKKNFPTDDLAIFESRLQQYKNM